MQTRKILIGGCAVLVLAIAATIYLRPISGRLAPPSLTEAGSDNPVSGQTDAAVADGGGQTTQTADPASAGPDVTDQAAAGPATSQDTATAPENPDTAPGTTPEPAMPPLARTDLRFELDGGFVVSGIAAPLMAVAALVDGIEVERVMSAADGAFFVVGFLGYSDTPRILTLIGDPDGAAIISDRRFVLAANPAPRDLMMADGSPAQTADGPDATGQDTVASADQTGETTANDLVADATTAPPLSPATPAILAVTETGVDVIQAATAANTPPDVMSSVALDTITYNPEGGVVLRGRATGEGFVQVYVDNAPVSRLPIDENGTWRSALPEVDTGVYTLRIDEIDSQGEVVSRIETPFLREDPADVIEAMADDVDNPGFTVATRTVQPGATLWAIAEERYGSGVLYVKVFEANRDRIRNPDLIYPGQVFMLPESGQ